MKLIVVKNQEELGIKAADVFEKVINNKPDCVLGLATGSTPISLYQELAKRNKKGIIDFSKVSSFNLDEYVGLKTSHPESYRNFMDNQLFNHININFNNTHLPDGLSDNLDSVCEKYDKDIESAGGIDLQLLGIGHNGHIGFNEPSNAFTLGTHIVEISDRTKEANSRFFENDPQKVPAKAITMGIGNIMKSKKIILVVTGEEKAEILKEAFYGEVSPNVQASILQIHPDVTVVADTKAARLIDIKTSAVV